MGPRVTGTSAEEAAVNLIKERLEGYGYEVSLQDVALPDVKSGSLTIGDDDIEIKITGGAGVTSPEGVTAELFNAKFGKEEDFTEDVVGKIALISRGDGITFQDKVDRAAAAGAVGVIIYNNIENAVLSFSANAQIPAGGISQEAGLALLGRIGEEVTLTAVIESAPTSSNIIATKSPANGKNDAEIVYVSAHIDSVPGSPGANDNATGTAAALELARVLKDYSFDKEIRFVFVGAEEIGLVGSNYYVSTLSEEELSRSIANFNMDMAATAWEEATAIYTNTLDGKSNLVTETANRVAAIIGTPSQLVLFERGASDHVGFHNVGIPAANFIRREPGTHKLEPYYHTPQDTIQYVSVERLKEMIDLVGASVYLVAIDN